MRTDTAKPPLFSDPALIDRIHELRKTDNTTNWYFLIRTWVYLVLVLGVAVWFFVSRADWGLSWWWNVPVALVASPGGSGPRRRGLLGAIERRRPHLASPAP